MSIKWIKRPEEYDDNKTLEQNRNRDRGVLRCPNCRSAVQIESTDTDCERCGQLFNSSGQALQPADQWEEPYYED